MCGGLGACNGFCAVWHIADSAGHCGTRRLLRIIRDAGFDEWQSESMVISIRGPYGRIQDSLGRNFARKSDLETGFAELRADNEKQRAEKPRADIYRALWIHFAGLVMIMVVPFTLFEAFGFEAL